MIRTILFILIASQASAQAVLHHRVQSVVDEVNSYREKHHRKPLTYTIERQQQCDRWAVHISRSLYHNVSDKRLGEVIGSFVTVESVVPLFMESQTHKKVLLDKNAKHICLSIYETPDTVIVKKNSVEEIPTLFHTVIRTY